MRTCCVAGVHVRLPGREDGQGQDEGHVQGLDAAGEIPSLRNGYDKYYKQAGAELGQAQYIII